MFVIHIYEKAAHGIKTTHRLSAAIYHLFPLNRHIQHFSVLGGGKIGYFIICKRIYQISHAAANASSALFFIP